MEERERAAASGGGLPECDREAFAQVWSRVAPGESCPVELTPAAETARQTPAELAPVAPAAAPVELGAENAEAERLQALVLDLLTGASVYRDLARRSGRAVGELRELYRLKLRQAKRLSAACFLLTGVRYWPRQATPVNPPESFFAALRQRFLAEGRLARQLEALAGASGDEDLRQLYAQLARETRDMARTIRAIVERET